MPIANIDDARKFAHPSIVSEGQGGPTRQEWRTAILQVARVEDPASVTTWTSTEAVTLDYLIGHSPYTTLSGVKAAETRTINKIKAELAAELAEALPLLSRIVEIHGQMKGCYLWTPRGNRAQRDRYAAERTNSVSFNRQGKRYQVTQDTTCSAQNVYYSLDVRVDGTKKDIRAIRNI